MYPTLVVEEDHQYLLGVVPHFLLQLFPMLNPLVHSQAVHSKEDRHHIIQYYLWGRRLLVPCSYCLPSDWNSLDLSSRNQAYPQLELQSE